MKNKFKNKKVAIIGFGIEGKDAYRFFNKIGSEIGIFDKSEEDELNLSGVDKKKVKLSFGNNYLSSGLKDYDLIVRSAGVRPDIPSLIVAKDTGVEVTTTIKLFFENYGGKIIGVTGTKGKGTTSTLIYEILKKSKINVELAGNIGKPVLDILEAKNDSEWCVLELSSFQLMDMNISPHIAVVLNITLDHMDWHTNREEYVSAKEHIVRHQAKGDYAVLNHDYKSSLDFQEITKAELYYFSRREQVRGSYIENDEIFLNIDKKEPIGIIDNLLLRGEHNLENITAACAASYLAGAGLHSIRSTVFSFTGLEHRLEFVKEEDGVGFYNDSFSTNVQTTLAAVNSFDEDITLILGGFDKGLDYKSLVKKLSEKSNLTTIILIGDLSARYQQWFEEQEYKGDLINMEYSRMDKIVQNAKKATRKGGVVLLSPSTSSFDMFENYKVRGDEFKKSVNKL